MENERTTQEVEADLETARTALATRQEELQTASTKVAEINGEYDAQSIAWKNFADRDAKKWLDSADRELFSAQAEVRQLSAAVKGLSEQIAKLEQEQAEAKRRDVELALAQEELSIITAALMTDDGTARLLLSIQEILARQKKMLALAQSIGAPTQKYEKISEHLRRAVVWAFFREAAFGSTAKRENFTSSR